MVELISALNDKLNSVVWGPVMLMLLLSIGVYFTFCTGFFQIRNFPKMLKNVFSGFTKTQKDKNGISPFEATATALAGTMGTGNIVGVATAIVAGGAGAIFWMWVSAFFGMMTKYAEILLSVKYRQKDKSGRFFGGPMYYIEKGLHQKWLAVLFACFCTLASFGIGNMTQINSISQTLKSSFNVSELSTGLVFALLVGFVILGGVTRITKITSAIIPLLSVFYFMGALVAIFVKIKAIPDAFSLILNEAFSLKSVGGGIFGYTFMNAIKFGFSRGVFSNEAGLGSAPIAHGASSAKSPMEQGLWGIFEVFLDTIIICTMTALVILTSGKISQNGELDGAALTAAAFADSLGGFAEIFLAISISFFAFATIIGWCYYGEACIKYLFKNSCAVKIYRIIYTALVILGAVMELKLVWNISDTLNGLMAIPNLIALIFLSKEVIAESRYGKIA